MRKNGKSYSELNYLISKIEIIKLYDFQSFFSKPIICKKLNVTKLLLADNLKTNLPFMYNFKPKSLCTRFKEKKSLNFITEFKNDEVLHFVGHGNDRYIDSNGQQHQNQIIYSNSSKYNSAEKFNFNKKLNSPLIILNNCFSGVRVSYSYVYDKGIYLQLMNMNAKNIVVSGDKIDDYVSSRIMLHFYTYLSQGKFVGEALVYAKRKFIKENKNGYANPKFWSPFFSISSQKVSFTR
jgi:CHAT domain-containing protein